jgi:hypothetical protein
MKTLMKQWVDNWKRVGPVLDRIKAEELRSPEYENGLDAFAPLLDWCCEHSEPDNETGLIEQQRIFMKARK